MCNISANLNTMWVCALVCSCLSVQQHLVCVASDQKQDPVGIYLCSFSVCRHSTTSSQFLPLGVMKSSGKVCHLQTTTLKQNYSVQHTVKSSDLCTMKLNEFHRNIWQQKPVGLMLKTITSGTSKGTSWLLVFRISANSCNVLSRGIIFSSCILFQTPSARCQSPFISVEFWLIEKQWLS